MIAVWLMDLLCEQNWRMGNALIDKAPIWYRVPIEFWWLLEKKDTDRCVKFYAKEKNWDADNPPFSQISVFLTRRRKDAEDRALAQIGIYQGRYRKK